MQVQKPKQGYKLVKSLFGKYEEIPEEWNFIKINQVCKKITSGGTPDRTKSEYYDDGNILWIKSGELNESYLNDSEEKITSIGLKNSSAKIFPKNTVLIAMYGATIGKTSILNKEASTNQAICAILPDDSFDPFYLQQLLVSKKNVLISLGMGAGQPNISQEIIKNFKVEWVTSLVEQQKIASILSNVDSLIQQTQKIIEENKNLKKGLMQKLLTKGIGHTKFKTEELGRKFLRYEIPENWNISKLNEFATVHGRIGWKNLRADEYVDKGPLMLSVWSLVETTPYGIDYNEGIHRLSQFRYEESPEIKLQNNDVLITKDGDIGRIGFVKKLLEPTTVNSHVVAVRVFDKSVNPEFLYWYMKTKQFQTYCIAYTSGTTVPLFTQKDLRNAKIPIPSLPEQEKISLILSDNTSMIYSLQQKKSKLESLKKGLMQKLLTGQIRVKV